MNYFRVIGFLFLAAVVAAAETGYHVSQKFSIPGDGGWDYISVDSAARRIYASHGNRVEVVDANSGKLVGQISDTPGVHGVAIAPDVNRGFTSNGGDKSVTIYELDTLKPTKRVSVTGTDFILYDSFSKRVFPMSEKITVLDATTGGVVGTVDLQGDPEAAASNGRGMIFVNLEDKATVAAVDAKTLEVKQRWPIEHCQSPHSMSYDDEARRIFVGCQDGLAVLDATTGKVVGRSLICSGVDASGFDAGHQLIFESCAEGVISVIRQNSPNDYELVDTIKTQLWAETMTFDPATGKIYLPTVELESVPSVDPQKPPQRRIRPGSFAILVVSK